MRVTLPVGISLLDWADQITLDLENQMQPRKLLNVLEWQDWAVQFTVYGTLPGDQPPNPYQFDNWRDWAERFCDAVET